MTLQTCFSSRFSMSPGSAAPRPLEAGFLRFRSKAATPVLSTLHVQTALRWQVRADARLKGLTASNLRASRHKIDKTMQFQLNMATTSPELMVMREMRVRKIRQHGENGRQGPDKC